MAEGRCGTTMPNCRTEALSRFNRPRRRVRRGRAIFAEENPIFQSKIASLQFPRPKIRRILAETGGGRTKAAASGGNRP